MFTFTKFAELVTEKIDTQRQTVAELLVEGRCDPTQLAKDYWLQVGRAQGLEQAKQSIAKVLEDLEHDPSDFPARSSGGNPYS